MFIIRMDIIKTLFDPLVTQERQQLAILEMLRNYVIPFSFDELNELFTFIRCETIKAWGRMGMFVVKYYPELFDIAMKNHPDFFLAILYGVKDKIISVRDIYVFCSCSCTLNPIGFDVDIYGRADFAIKYWIKLIKHHSFSIESFSITEKSKKIINDSVSGSGRNTKAAIKTNI